MLTFVFAFILLIVAAVSVVMTSRSFSVYIPEQNGLYFTDFEVEYSDIGVVEPDGAVHIKDRFKITFTPIKRGETQVDITCYSDGSDKLITQYYMASRLGVGPLDIVYEPGSISVPNVAGYPVFYITAALTSLLFAVYLFLIFRDRLREYILFI